MADSLTDLTAAVRQFADARDWEQFHSPKNLAMALAVEASEVVERFQWLTQKASLDLSEEDRERVALELADVQIYLVRLADRLGIDLIAAASRKLDLNSQRYPADRARGSAKKYTEYE